MTIQGLDNPAVKPALLLDFAKAKRLDPRISYSRASVGTYYDKDGVLQTAPAGVARFDHNPMTGESLGLLIEDSRVNQIRSPSNFTFNDWHFTQCKMTPNAAVAPDGRMTAALIQQTDGTSTRQFICTSYSIGTTASPWTVSVYVKRFNYDFVILAAGDQDSQSRGARFGYLQAQLRFQFSTKTITTLASTSWGGAITDSGYEELPGGWFRLWMTKASSVRANYWGIAVQQNLAGGSQTTSDLSLVTGDGTSGVYFWGLQWESGGFRSSHIQSPVTFTSRSSTATYYDANGVIQIASANTARSAAYLPDENGTMRPIGLLLESSAINEITSSMPTASGGGITNTQVTGLPGVFSTARRFTSDGGSDRRLTLGNNTADVTFTYSFYARLGTQGTSVFVRNGTGLSVIFNLQTLQITNSWIAGSAKIENAGNGWYRCSARVVGTGASGFLVGVSSGDTIVANAGDNMIVGGFQLEQSAYPTSYIPTSGSQVTRAADVSTSSAATRSADVAEITGDAFNAWFDRSLTGSTLIEARYSSASSHSAGNVLMYGATSGLTVWDPFNYRSTGIWASGGNTYFRAAGGINADSMGYGPVVPRWSSPGVLHKWAFGVETGPDSRVVTNGTLGGSHDLPSGVDGSTYQRFRISGSAAFGARISKIAYWRSRLPNAVLQNITR